MIGRLPILDIAPTVFFGGEFVGVKAIANESITVSATIIREGHEALTAEAILFETSGKEFGRFPMRGVWGAPDRFEIEVEAKTTGLWHFAIEA